MEKSKVLISDKLSESGLAVLQGIAEIAADYKPGLKEKELCEIIGNYDALVIRSGTTVTANVIEHAKKLKVIGRAGIGVDNVDVPAASKRGIVVMNTPTGNAVTTAEHALTLLLSLARKIPQATASMRAGKWEKNKFQGREVTDKTLGIVGLGTIGRIVAERACGLKMRVVAFDPVLTTDKAATLGITRVSLDELLEKSDFITLHAPLTPETKNLINEKAFAKMKKGVLIVNAARGGIVDEQALEQAIKSGKVAGAALDVFEKEPVDPSHPLLKLDEVICTPHLGASTEEAQERVAVEICEQIAAYVRDGVIRNAVNVPALPKEIAEQLQPYLTLGKRLGRLLGQLEPVDVKELRITCSGEAGQVGVRPIAHAVVAGYLECYLEEPVNPISAPFLAKDRGIAVAEVTEDDGRRGYASVVRVSAVGESGKHTAAGTLSATGEPRLVDLDNYDLDAVLDGTTIVMHNEDRPGVIGAVGTILGARNINVSRLQVGLDPKTRQAIALWNVDSPVPAEALEDLRKLENVRSAIAVHV